MNTFKKFGLFVLVCLLLLGVLGGQPAKAETETITFEGPSAVNVMEQAIKHIQNCGCFVQSGTLTTTPNEQVVFTLQVVGSK